MKQIFSPAPRGLLIAYRVMIAVLVLLVVLLSAGSLFALVRRPDSTPLVRIGGPGGQSEYDGNAGEVSVFNGIGRLRIPVAGNATMILSIAFPYPPHDRPFSEEIASHIGDFRSIAAEYFSSLPAEKIISLDEDAAKTEILRRCNTLLRLGKITALYFNDLMIIE